MSAITVTLERITCRNTTEAGHDEVYYLSPAIRRFKAGISSTDPPLPPGPTVAQAPMPAARAATTRLGTATIPVHYRTSSSASRSFLCELTRVSTSS